MSNKLSAAIKYMGGVTGGWQIKATASQHLCCFPTAEKVKGECFSLRARIKSTWEEQNTIMPQDIEFMGIR